MAQVLLGWDLEDDRGFIVEHVGGAGPWPVPVDADHLRRTPLVILGEIFAAIRSDIRPTSEEGKAYDDGSAQTGRSVSRPDGSFS